MDFANTPATNGDRLRVHSHPPQPGSSSPSKLSIHPAPSEHPFPHPNATTSSNAQRPLIAPSNAHETRAPHTLAAKDPMTHPNHQYAPSSEGTVSHGFPSSFPSTMGAAALNTMRPSSQHHQANHPPSLDNHATHPPARSSPQSGPAKAQSARVHASSIPHPSYSQVSGFVPPVMYQIPPFASPPPVPLHSMHATHHSTAHHATYGVPAPVGYHMPQYSANAHAPYSSWSNQVPNEYASPALSATQMANLRAPPAWSPHQAENIGAPSSSRSDRRGPSMPRKSIPPPCRYGSRCRMKATCMFSHPGQNNTNQNRTRCKFGSRCTRENCFYSHELINILEEEKQAEEKRQHSSEALQALRRWDLAEFTQPKARELSRVPDVFTSGDDYFATLIENCLFEYNEFFAKITSEKFVAEQPLFKAKSEIYNGESWIVVEGGRACLPAKGVQYNLIKAADQFRIVINQDRRHPERLRVFPSIEASETDRGVVEIRVLGYIGSYCANIRNAKHMLGLRSFQRPDVLQSIVDPAVELVGEWSDSRLPEDSHCNESQRRAVNSLWRRLEVIQGPPGTGKSTTIAEIVKYKCLTTPETRAYGPILITTARNKALDCIAEKLSEMKILVFGSEGRMGACSMRHTLEALVGEQPRVKAAMVDVEAAKNDVDAAKNDVDTWESWSQQSATSGSADDFAYAASELFYAEQGLKEARERARDEILDSTQVVLSTIATTGKMSRVVGDRVHTVLVDEAGCVEEIAMASILKLHPKNVLLIGDHKQLPPITLLGDAEARKKNNNRSLMERFCQVSPNFSTLTIQYRMHQAIQDIVSELNYGGQLSMGDIERSRQPAVLWHDSTQFEEAVGVSYRNAGEADVCEQVYLRERNMHPEQSIMMIAFYNPQVHLLREMHAKHGDRKLSIVSVDAAQGLEADCVILSCVRSAPPMSKGGLRTIGFLQDERRINVAISRAKEVLHFVGSRTTFARSSHSSWKHVLQCVEFAS